MKSIILIGDSIRVGYQEYTTRQLKDVARLWWPSQNGGPTSKIVANLDEWVTSRQPDVVHINAGLHDIKRPRTATGGVDENQVPPAEYRKNVENILADIMKHTKARVFWATTTPVIYERNHASRPIDLFEEDVREYNGISVDVATKLGVEIDELYQVVVDGGTERLLGPDGIHFTDEGYRLLGQTVADFLRARRVL